MILISLQKYDLIFFSFRPAINEIIFFSLLVDNFFKTKLASLGLTQTLSDHSYLMIN